METFSDAIETLWAKEESALKDCVDEASKVALGKSYVEAKEEAKKKFDEYVEDFYSHSPLNSYEPAYDMYNVLVVEASEKDNSFTYRWDEGAMNQFERASNGGSLAELTVGYGMHGGARSSKPDKAGRVVSGFHYRYPMPYYPYWGEESFSTDAPYDKFMEWLNEYFNSAEYREVYDKYFQSAVVELMPKYMA